MIPVVGVALGGGAARGWAHMGVLSALEERGIVPGVVAGASIGALVGAALSAGNLEALCNWAMKLRRLDVLRLLDARIAGGVIEGNRVMRAIEEFIPDRDITELARPFGAVATDLERGRTVWLRDGPVIEAVRASCALPGLFPPVRHHDAWLMDGGLVDPVPVTLCRLLGAELVIAVNLSPYRHRVTARRARAERSSGGKEPSSGESVQADERGYLDRLQRFVAGLLDNDNDDGDGQREPALLDVVSSAINIMQERVTRSRLAGDPPELEIVPDVQELGLMDFHRAALAVEKGVESVESRAHELERLLSPSA